MCMYIYTTHAQTLANRYCTLHERSVPAVSLNIIPWEIFQTLEFSIFMKMQFLPITLFVYIILLFNFCLTFVGIFQPICHPTSAKTLFNRICL